MYKVIHDFADMQDNLPVIESVINHMYNTILYAEFNIRKHICYIGIIRL